MMIRPSPPRSAGAGAAPSRGSRGSRCRTSRRRTAARPQPLAGLEDLRPAVLGARGPCAAPRRLIRACEATKRCASSASDISSENSATGLPCSIAAFSAMFVTSADLPIEGRAAMMIRLPGWKPPVISSRSLKPDGVPVSAVCSRERRWSLSSSSCSTSSIDAEVLLAVVVGDLEDVALGPLDQLARRAPRGSRRSPGSRWVVVSRRRSSALLWTMRAYSRTLPAAGTAPASASTVAGPPTCSSSPVCRSCSVTVSTSMLAALLVELRASRGRSSRAARGRSAPGLSPSLMTSAVERRVGEQDRPEHRLLGLEVVRRERARCVLLLDGGHEPSARTTAACGLRRCRAGFATTTRRGRRGAAR